MAIATSVFNRPAAPVVADTYYTFERWRELGGGEWSAQNAHFLDFTGLDLSTEQVLPTGETAIAVRGASRLVNLGRGTLNYPVGVRGQEDLRLTIDLPVPGFIFIDFNYSSVNNIYSGGGQQYFGVTKGARFQMLQQPGDEPLAVNALNPDYDYYTPPVDQFGVYVLESETPISSLVFSSVAAYGLNIRRIWASPTQAERQGQVYLVFRDSKDDAILRVINEDDPFDTRPNNTDGLERIFTTGGITQELDPSALRFRYYFAPQDLNIPNVEWIDSENNPTYPALARANDLLKNFSNKDLNAGGILFRANEVLRARVNEPTIHDWEIWRPPISDAELKNHIADDPRHESLFTREKWVTEEPTYAPPEGAIVPTFTGADTFAGATGSTPEGVSYMIQNTDITAFTERGYTTAAGTTGPWVTITSPTAGYLFIEFEHRGDRYTTGASITINVNSEIDTLVKPNSAPDVTVPEGSNDFFYNPNGPYFGRYIIQTKTPVSTFTTYHQDYESEVLRIWFSPTALSLPNERIYDSWVNRRTGERLPLLVNQEDVTDQRLDTTGLEPYIPTNEWRVNRNIVVQGGGSFANPVGASNFIKYLVQDKIAFIVGEIDWRDTTGGDNGSGQYSINLTQLGFTPDFDGLSASDTEYSSVSLGTVSVHNPGSYGGQGTVRIAGVPNSITFALKREDGVNVNDWSEGWSWLADRAHYCFSAVIPIKDTKTDSGETTVIKVIERDTNLAVETALEQASYPELVLDWDRQEGGLPGVNLTAVSGDQTDFTLTQGNVEIARNTGRWHVWVQARTEFDNSSNQVDFKVELDGVNVASLFLRNTNSASATFFIDTRSTARTLTLYSTGYAGETGSVRTQGRVRFTSMGRFS